MSELIMHQWQQITESSWLVLFSILGFGVGVFVYRRCGNHPLSHPLLISTPLIGLALYLLKIDYVDYYAANGVLNWLLGAATVALAVPLSQQIKNLSALWPIILLTGLSGGLFAAVSVLVIGNWFVLEPIAILSLVAKSVTTPIAMIITEQLGGLITLITVLVLLTGIVGIIVAEPIFTFFNLHDERWQGLILGVSAHAIGTLKAFEKSPRCGAFSTVGMGLNGIWTTLFLIPLMQAFGP
tara:strand:+ start:1937 stop:2656 length:720 start_codon:yes stop_codon:yes gene_type:complete